MPNDNNNYLPRITNLRRVCVASVVVGGFGVGAVGGALIVSAFSGGAVSGGAVSVGAVIGGAVTCPASVGIAYNGCSNLIKEINTPPLTVALNPDAQRVDVDKDRNDCDSIDHLSV